MDADDRPDPPMVGTEREQLGAFLDFLRATVVKKAAGLSEQDAHRPVLPSPLTTVAGLLSHLRWVEAYWFGTVLAGQPDLGPYSDEDPDGEFRVAADLPMAELVADYGAQCAQSRAIVAGLDLAVPVESPRGRITPHWVVVHMIEETARHAGHLDVVRELLDGVTGE